MPYVGRPFRVSSPSSANSGAVGDTWAFAAVTQHATVSLGYVVDEVMLVSCSPVPIRWKPPHFGGGPSRKGLARAEEQALDEATVDRSSFALPKST